MSLIRPNSLHLAVLVAVAVATLGANAAPPELNRYLPEIEASADGVGKYEKIEFAIRVDQTYENAFDAAEADLSLLIETPSGRKLTLPAFWHQRYQRRRLGTDSRADDWFYPLGKPVWTARFTGRPSAATWRT